jgi:hypothetical protein
LAGLVKKIDELVAANEEKKLAAVINFIGEDNEETKAKIKEFGEKQELKKIPLTLTADAEKFKIGKDAEVTVMHYKEKTVRFNHSVAKGGLTAEAVTAILEGVKKILE